METKRGIKNENIMMEDIVGHLMVEHEDVDNCERDVMEADVRKLVQDNKLIHYKYLSLLGYKGVVLVGDIDGIWYVYESGVAIIKEEVIYTPTPKIIPLSHLSHEALQELAVNTIIVTETTQKSNKTPYTIYPTNQTNGMFSLGEINRMVDLSLVDMETQIDQLFNLDIPEGQDVEFIRDVFNMVSQIKTDEMMISKLLQTMEDYRGDTKMKDLR
jgi:hypothetical protein